MARNKVEKNIAWDTEKKAYYVTLYYGRNSNGKAIRKTRTVSNLKDAKKILKDHNRQIAAGTAIPPSPELFTQYAENFLQFKAISCSATTNYGYSNIFKNHLSPYFQDKRLSDISARDIQDYITFKVNSGLKVKTVKKHVNLLFSILENATKQRIIHDNPVKLVEKLRPEESQKNFLNTEEASLLCQKVTDSQLEIPVKLALLLGLRRGEVLGLKWDHIDFASATVRIVNTRTEAGHDIIEKRPKTDSSIRVLRICDSLLSALKKHKKFQESVFERMGTRTDFVCTMDNGKPFDPNYLSECFKNFEIKEGLKPVRFHDLRHSFASIANDAGTSMRDISSAMGHSNISITSDVYTHDFNQLKSKAVNAVAESISRLQSAQASGKENMPIQQENAEENTTLNRLQKVRKGVGKRQ